MSEDKFIHVFVNLPRLGLLRETTDSRKVVKKAKRRIWKQLKWMSIDKFTQYCEVRRLKESPIVDWKMEGDYIFTIPKSEDNNGS